MFYGGGSSNSSIGGSRVGHFWLGFLDSLDRKEFCKNLAHLYTREGRETALFIQNKISNHNAICSGFFTQVGATRTWHHCTSRYGGTFISVLRFFFLSNLLGGKEEGVFSLCRCVCISKANFVCHGGGFCLGGECVQLYVTSQCECVCVCKRIICIYAQRINGRTIDPLLDSVVLRCDLCNHG